MITYTYKDYLKLLCKYYIPYLSANRIPHQLLNTQTPSFDPPFSGYLHAKNSSSELKNIKTQTL